MSRRRLTWIVVLAALLHVVGIARTSVPAQDGLKFLRTARQFQSQSWVEVIRGSDQHPLYPAAIALIEPIIAFFNGDGPDTWRIAAQSVSALASIATIFPLFALTRSLFGSRTAALAALLFVVLPAPARLGHETLSDPLALLGFILALRWGEVLLRTGRRRAAVFSGIAAGLGFWTRPEVAIIAVVILAAICTQSLARLRPSLKLTDWSGARTAPTLAVTFLTLVGTYALIKGEVSEKLAIRKSAALASVHDLPRGSRPGLPPGLDDPRWDFTPKEENARVVSVGLPGAALRLARDWAEGLGGVFGLLALWGVFRVKPRGPGAWVVAGYLVLFSAIALRHVVTLHYLSGRHSMTLILATLPWAAAGTIAAARSVGRSLKWRPEKSGLRIALGVGLLIVVCVGAELRPRHASRWGHEAAASWLRDHASEGDAILDTRGWVAFLTGMRGYDPWHISQALSDQRLAFVVVGADELNAPSNRARTLRAILDYASEPAAAFPSRRGGNGADVLVYRFHPPETWKGLAP